jgi:capsular polysaccharide biosynthesis protein
MEPDEKLKEIKLMDYAKILWKRKWLIIIPTILISIAVGIWSFRQTPVWEADAIFQPSKFLSSNEQGQFTEIVFADPKQVAGQINQASYNGIIAGELNIDLRDFPQLKAENLKDTKLVRVTVRDTDINRASKILNSLFHLLKSDFDRKADVEIQSIDTQIIDKENQIKANDLIIKDSKNQIELTKLRIKDKENGIIIKENGIKIRNNDIKLKDLEIQSKSFQKDKINQAIETDKNKIKISEDRAAGILDEMKSVKGKIDEIEKLLQKTIAQKKQGADAIVLLLYSNEIQQNLRYYETLDEKASVEKITRENLNLGIRDKEEQLRQLDNQVHQVETQKDSIKTEINNIETDISSIKTEIEKINTEIVDMRNGIDKTINASNTIKSDSQFLGNKKARIDYALLVKEPTPSNGPVWPIKRKNVMNAAFLSLAAFCFLALFLDYFKRNRSSQG